MKDLSWKTLSSEYLYKDTWFTIRKEACQRQDGQIITPYYVYEFPTWVTAVALTEDGKVILERQYRHAVGQVFWEFPAGKIDSGEKSAETAVRELKEETGFTAREWRYLTTIHPVIGYANEKIDLFLAKGLQQTGAQLDAGEFLEMQEVPVAELLPMIRRGEVSDVKTQIGIFWLEKILGAGW